VFLTLGITNYTQYNSIARSEEFGFVEQSLVYIYPLIGAAAMLCAERVRSIKIFLIVFGVWAVPAFFVGLRGEVLFPAALMLPFVMRRTNLRLRIVPVSIASVALLWLISFGRVFRAGSDWAMAIRTASPIDALAELGGSLRPVFEVVRWNHSGIVGWLWGTTYWAPFERFFMRVMPFIDPIPASLDNRLMNVAIGSHAGGAYGFSIAAEAYVNFGYAGAAGVGLLTGYAMRKLGHHFAVTGNGAMSAALAYALFYHIRQGYIGAFGSFIVVALFTWALLKLDNLARGFVGSREFGANRRLVSGHAGLE
jgi:O-antigen polysaccharide polymerase Wzy